MISIHALFNLPEKKLRIKNKDVSKHQVFKTRHVLLKIYISTSKETVKLLLNIRIIPSSNKIKLFLQQFVN